MFTIYFTIPRNEHQLTMQEILESDKLNAGFLEHVASIPNGELYSWHDLHEAEIDKVICYIAENIGNYRTEVECENFLNR